MRFRTGVRIHAEEDTVFVEGRISHIKRSYTRVEAEVTCTALVGRGSQNIRIDETGSFEHFVVTRRERFVTMGLIAVPETSPESVIRHAVSNTRFALVGVFIPPVGTDLQLRQRICRQVIKPDKGVMNLATLRLQSQVPVIEGEGGVDDGYIIRRTRQVILHQQFVMPSRIDRSSGIRVEERVDDQRRAAAMVDTYGGRALVHRHGTIAVIHKFTVGDRQFR